MNDMEVLAHTQHVARHFLAYRGPLEELVDLVLKSMGEDPGEADAVSRFLRRSHVQLLLQNHYETALWRGIDGGWNLVSQALPSDSATARRRLQQRPPNSGSMCAFCFLDEREHAARALVPELDACSNPVPGVRLHPTCVRARRQLRALAESTEAAA